jgi:isoaspartyl peptidase/L-asparaginase-like protein (Ntn-hydrolase superfamily)
VKFVDVIIVDVIVIDANFTTGQCGADVQGRMSCLPVTGAGFWVLLVACL